MDIRADVEGIGKISDRDLPKYMTEFTLFDDLVGEFDYNETQMMIMANTDYFISVCGGNYIVSCFGGTMISYNTRKRIKTNYFGEIVIFKNYQTKNVIPVYDMIGKINEEDL